jgi:outer membrane protein assembly factor BamA
MAGSLCWILLAALAASFGPCAQAAKLTDTEHTNIAEPRPRDVPDDAQLEASGAVIGDVQIDVANIFNEGDPRENNGLFRLADRLHIRTRVSAIRAQLLFKSGDRYQARKLAETERNLRLLAYVYDAHIVPVRFHDGKVDVRVITHDVWTLSPGLSFGRTGGTSSTNVNISDSNLFGSGKSLEFEHLESVARTSDGVSWSDPNTFGSHWTTAATYLDSSDGNQRSLQIARPFFELDARWSVTLAATDYVRTVSLYSFGQIVDQFRDDETSYTLSAGISKGLRDGWVLRWIGGIQYDRSLFGAAPSVPAPALQLPPDRIVSYPFVGFDLLQDNYRKLYDQNQIGRTEDFYFGTEITGSIGLSNTQFGADLDAIMLAASARKGFEFDESRQQLFLTSTFTSRIQEERVRNLIATGTASYYWRWQPDWMLYANLTGTVTNALDPDAQVQVGGDNGLRGYPLRFESGASSAVFTLEQRFYTDWYPFRLVRVGGAVFADAGRTWGAAVVGNSDPGLLSDVGFGLRLGNTRSGLGNVLHIDLAFPLKDIYGIKRVQFLVQTQQSF